MKLTKRPDGATEFLEVTTAGTCVTPSPFNPNTGIITLIGADTPGSLLITLDMGSVVDIHTDEKYFLSLLIFPVPKLKHGAFREREYGQATSG
ncbi:hypothetical protein OAJ57_01885 [Alphaproteobacteria bacterium]|nr:hypothetical protein [Alphaproteobacteria bacterium]